MDNNTSVLPVQRSQREFTGFRLLKRIDENNTSAPRLKWLWDKMQECENVWDDFTRGRVEHFLTMFQDPDVEFYELENAGLVVLGKVVEAGACDIHYLVWQRDYAMKKLRDGAVEIFDYIFFKRHCHHIVGEIPSTNSLAIRFALSVGMKFEGELRENFKYNGRYYNTHFYGLLAREYDNVRGRLVP
jgi:RimJ/RimL family protein N-acetyltransferase